MAINQRVIVLGVSRYKFPNEKTGELIEGCKVHYMEEGFENQADSIGYVPQTAIIDFEEFEGFDPDKVPGVYTAALTVSMRTKKPTLKVVGFEYIKPYTPNALPPVNATANAASK